MFIVSRLAQQNEWQLLFCGEHRNVLNKTSKNAFALRDRFVRTVTMLAAIERVHIQHKINQKISRQQTPFYKKK